MTRECGMALLLMFTTWRKQGQSSGALKSYHANYGLQTLNLILKIPHAELGSANTAILLNLYNSPPVRCFPVASMKIFLLASAVALVLCSCDPQPCQQVTITYKELGEPILVFADNAAIPCEKNPSSNGYSQTINCGGGYSKEFIKQMVRAGKVKSIPRHKEQTMCADVVTALMQTQSFRDSVLSISQ